MKLMILHHGLLITGLLLAIDRAVCRGRRRG